MTRRGVRRIAGAMVSIGVVLMAAQGSTSATRTVAVNVATPACGPVAPGVARCLGLFLHTPARRAASPGGPTGGLSPTDIRSAYGLAGTLGPAAPWPSSTPSTIPTPRPT